MYDDGFNEIRATTSTTTPTTTTTSTIITTIDNITNIHTWTTTSTPMYSTSHMSIPYTTFDPGPSTSNVYPQTSMFPFPPYSAVHVPFDYPQVT